MTKKCELKLRSTRFSISKADYKTESVAETIPIHSLVQSQSKTEILVTRIQIPTWLF